MMFKEKIQYLGHRNPPNTIHTKYYCEPATAYVTRIVFEGIMIRYNGNPFELINMKSIYMYIRT